MPDEKYDLVSEMQGKVERLEGDLNEEIRKNVSLNSILEKAKCSHFFNSASKGLTDTQVERLGKLAEGIEFDTAEQYAEKLSVLKESYFNNVARKSANVSGEVEVLTEDTNMQEAPTFATHEIAKYSAYLDRAAKHTK